VSTQVTDLRRPQSIRMEVGEDDFTSVEPKRLTQLLGYSLGAIWRRKRLAAILFALGLLSAVGLLAMVPKSYHVETKILAQRQQALPMLSRYATAEEPPTYAASEIIHRIENLRAIAEKTHLVEQYPFPPTPRLTREEKLATLAALLDKRLTVTVGEGTLAIAIDWPKGDMAAQLVEAALQSFLDARRMAELSSIEEAITLLESRAGKLQSEIETMESEAASKSSAASKLRISKRRDSRLSRFDPSAAQTKAMLDARRRVIRETEDFRQRRLEELQAQLSERLAVYGESYPSVQNLKREIQSFSREPQQLVALRAEERELAAALKSRGITSSSDLVDDPDGLGSRLYDGFDERDEVDAQRRFARIRYQSLLERIESSKIDLEAARTVFKYRYSVIYPAQTPDAPNRPNVQTGMVLGFFWALILAAIGATLADLRANRFVAAWQIERELSLPIIAEVRRS
jgi:uncharacterized protein involved in exopolysaccharide biosynthesis